jgi:hypothetical protein
LASLLSAGLLDTQFRHELAPRLHHLPLHHLPLHRAVGEQVGGLLTGQTSGDYPNEGCARTDRRGS